jgi:UDP-glucose 4-epimerase
MNVLVTGAAGYIGSVIVAELIRCNHTVIALDNLSLGHKKAVNPQATFVHTDLSEYGQVNNIFSKHSIDAVIHLAGHSLVGESMRDPGKFFRANTLNGLNLLEAMRHNGVKKFVFSSTAAVYGEPKEIPLTETSDCTPINPYGASKLQFEQILPWYLTTYGTEYMILRYFNAAGATDTLGEDHPIESHLIPLILETALGFRPKLEIFGSDYDTKDGSCIRDYVHVSDLATAHVKALNLIEQPQNRVYNLGIGHGYSNIEVIAAARNITGLNIESISSPRRPGDPPILIANADRAFKELDWTPRFRDIESIVESAWQWKAKYPNGYVD